jgi:hypothetical protein
VEKPDQIVTIDDTRRTLSPREKTALEEYEQSATSEPIALSTALEMYELYLNGHSYEEILKVNRRKGKGFTLGQIVDAGIRFQWAERRFEHQKSLFDGIKTKVAQTQHESVSFITDVIAAAHKLHGNRIKAYLQSGDEADLGDLRIESLKQYRDAVQMMMVLTGQDPDGNKKTPQNAIQVNVNTTAASTEVKTPEDEPQKQLTGEDYFKLLQLASTPEPGDE